MVILPSQASELIALVLAADEVISFNGKKFDMLVLRRHYGMKSKDLSDGNHFDLLDEITKSGHNRVSLHRLALKNLGEKKHTDGRRMDEIEVEGLKIACRSDVWQTYRLWQMWKSGHLQLPEQGEYKTRLQLDNDNFDVGPGHHMPELCPHCHSANTLILCDQDEDDMTEGQASDYEAGMWGTFYCEACMNSFDYGF